MTPMRKCLLLPLLLLAAAATPAPAQDTTTIYWCTDAQGLRTLQDFPCAQDQRQQARTVPRLRERAAPEPDDDVAPEPAATAGLEPPVVEIVVRTPPRPMYECITPEGERYLSDDGQGNPRPAPVWFWDSGYWSGPAPGVPPGPRGADRQAAGIASPGMSTSPGPSLTTPRRDQPPPPSRPRHRGHYPVPGGGGWIRDECHPLPQARVCGLLSDRRTEIRRRMFNAQPSERAVLREEERGITARLDADCNVR